jgi:16S rRNA processing protein RimM
MSAPANNLLPVAKVIKSFGTDGGMIIRYSPYFQEDIDVKRPVFISYDGLPVPFFIESIANKGNSQSVIKLSGINSDRMAGEISGETIFIERSGSKTESSQPSPEDFTGFGVITQEGISVGEITKFYDYPGNPCFCITRNDNSERELLLPVHEDIIKKIDPRKRVITAQIPEGLLDI